MVDVKRWARGDGKKRKALPLIDDMELEDYLDLARRFRDEAQHHYNPVEENWLKVESEVRQRILLPAQIQEKFGHCKDALYPTREKFFILSCIAVVGHRMAGSHIAACALEKRSRQGVVNQAKLLVLEADVTA